MVRTDLHTHTTIHVHTDARRQWYRERGTRTVERSTDWRNTRRRARGKDPAGCKDELSCVTSVPVIKTSSQYRSARMNVSGARPTGWVGYIIARLCPFGCSRYSATTLRSYASTLKRITLFMHASLQKYTVILSAREYSRLLLAVSRVWIYREITRPINILETRAIYLLFSKCCF